MPTVPIAVATLAVLLLAAPGRAAEEISQVPVFEGGKHDYHTFRIPAVVVSNKGTLLAFCEGRKESPRDASPTDLVLKRSLDGGVSWGPC